MTLIRWKTEDRSLKKNKSQKAIINPYKYVFVISCVPLKNECCYSKKLLNLSTKKLEIFSIGFNAKYSHKLGAKEVEDEIIILIKIEDIPK